MYCFVGLRRKKGVSFIGRRLRLIRPAGVREGKRYTITVMTSLTEPQGFIMSNPTTQSNTAEFFLATLDGFCRNGYIKGGDVLVLDNAKIHYCELNANGIDLLVATYGFRLRFLPTYSPELNPCELIFAQTKNWLRKHRTVKPLLWDVADAYASIDINHVQSYYNKCLYHYDE
jgi:transposase